MIKLYGQFLVTESESKRLLSLAHDLKTKSNMSRKDILAQIKNEVRKAERDLKRQNGRDKICFGCRQFGHLLSQCTSSANSVTGGGGDICFKCGSTEHTSRTCKRKASKIFSIYCNLK